MISLGFTNSGWRLIFSSSMILNFKSNFKILKAQDLAANEKIYPFNIFFRLINRWNMSVATILNKIKVPPSKLK